MPHLGLAHNDHRVNGDGTSLSERRVGFFQQSNRVSELLGGLGFKLITSSGPAT